MTWGGGIGRDIREGPRGRHRMGHRMDFSTLLFVVLTYVSRNELILLHTSQHMQYFTLIFLSLLRYTSTFSATEHLRLLSCLGVHSTFSAALRQLVTQTLSENWDNLQH